MKVHLHKLTIYSTLKNDLKSSLTGQSADLFMGGDRVVAAVSRVALVWTIISSGNKNGCVFPSEAYPPFIAHEFHRQAHFSSLNAASSDAIQSMLNRTFKSNE